MSSHNDPLQFLADVITKSTSNDSVENNCIPSQSPEVATAEITTSSPTMTVNHDLDMNPSTRRKSKLKKSNRRPPKSVLETATTDAAKSASSNLNKNNAASRSQQQHAAAAGGRMEGSSKVINSAQLLSQITLGVKLSIYWPDDDKYYPGVVSAHQRGRVYTIHYEDGEVETVDLATEKFRILGDESATVAAIGQLRKTLEGLRQEADGGNKSSARKILTILRDDLGLRTDITFHTLLHTGIGKTVNKLAKNENKKISQAAIPVLQKWKKIDEVTPADAKVAAKASMTSASAVSGGGGGGPETGNGTPRKPKSTTVAPATPANHATIDLTDSPSPHRPPPSSKKRKANTRAAAKVTPGSVRNATHVKENEKILSSAPSPPELAFSPSLKDDEAVVSSKGRKANKNAAAKFTPGSVRNVKDNKENEKNMSSAPSPPELATSSSLNENDVIVSGKKKSKSAPAADGGAKARTQTKADSVKQANSNVKPGGKSSDAKAASATTTNSNGAVAKQASNAKAASKQPSNAKSGTSAAATPTTIVKPPTKKKRSFHDQILYTMLTTCKPYTLKSLAKDTNTTVEALRHAMLSFLDKKLVICKEFPSKKGSNREPKKLYWANPMSLMEVQNGSGNGKGKNGGGGGVIVREFSKLLSTSAEIDEARALRQQLEQQHRAVQDELIPLLAIPTMKELGDQISAEEQKLKEVHNEIQEVKDRMANASKPPPDSTMGSIRMGSGGYAAAAYYPANRFQKRPPAKPQNPTTLKRKINHMLGEYKTRKRKCMDFVEELSEAMEKKTKDVLGDKVLALDTDEMEWGYYEDGSTGKVFGKPKAKDGGRGGLLGRKCNGHVGLGGKDNEAVIVKIPAKYKDV